MYKLVKFVAKIFAGLVVGIVLFLAGIFLGGGEVVCGILFLLSLSVGAICGLKDLTGTDSSDSWGGFR